MHTARTSNSDSQNNWNIAKLLVGESDDWLSHLPLHLVPPSGIRTVQHRPLKIERNHNKTPAKLT